MLRVSCGLSHIAPVLLLASVLAAPARAQTGLELPAPSGATSVQVIAIRAEVSPRPDGAHQAVVSLTVLNPEADTQELLLAAGGEGTAVTRAGESVRQTEAGLFKLHLEAAEVAVLRVDRRIRVADGAFLAADDAGWLGEARGPLLQPVRTLSVSHPTGSPWRGAALDVHVEPGGQLLACSLLASEGALAAADGSVSWSFAAGTAPEQLSLSWPTVENETFLPIDQAEAQAFEQHWNRRRGIEVEAVRLVRAGILVVHGEGFDDERTRRAFEPAKRPGWAPIPGPPTRSEREAAASLAAFADRLELAGAPRVVASAPPPAATRAPIEPAPRRVATPPEPASPPPAPSRRTERAAAEPTPDFDIADTDPLVTRAPDLSWRSETLLQTVASVPSTPERARRWARRVVRGGHGISRAVIARESIPALHGKTWGPGYVAEFFSRTPWYQADPSYDFDSLSEDEKTAHGVLDSLIEALQDGREFAPDEPAAAQQVAVASPPPARAETRSPRPATPRGQVETPVAAPEEPAELPIPSAEGPPVPWLQSPAQARIFVFKEKARGLDPARVALAIATIEARHGKPFATQPDYRGFFDGQPWYQPQSEYGPEQLSIPARESITLLRNALDTRTY